MSCNLFPKMKTEGKRPHSRRPALTKQAKGIIRKENWRPVSCIFIDTKYPIHVSKPNPTMCKKNYTSITKRDLVQVWETDSIFKYQLV